MYCCDRVDTGVVEDPRLADRDAVVGPFDSGRHPYYSRAPIGSVMARRFGAVLRRVSV